MAITSTFTRDDFGKMSLLATFTAQNEAVVFQPKRPTAMSIQSTGAFTSSTLDIQASNDGVTYYALPTAVSLAALGAKSVALADLGYKFYRVIQLAAAETHSAYISWVESV